MVRLRPAGALVERDFRLLFAATSITSFGDLVATVALAFAVLDVGGVSDLGAVLAVRQVASALMLVFGGVLSDRLPRNRILVGASVLQGAAQAAIAATVLTGDATVLSFALLGALWGAGDGFVVPAEVGLIPQTVTPARLQQANALQGLSRGAVRILGPAGGGVLVVALSPGWALAVDSLTFFVSAALLARIRIAPRAQAAPLHYLQELRDGWKEFTSRTWLWSTVLLFSVGNLVFQFYPVLGPAIADERLGGARAWATILACGGVGSLAGSVLALRYRPRRPLVASIVASASIVPLFATLAVVAPTEVIATAAFVFGLGITLHVALWFTVFQREVPEHAQSRVSSYDSLGSVVLSPLGAAIAGPLALAIGTSTALWLAAGVIVANTSTMLMIPAVRRIRGNCDRREPVDDALEPAPEEHADQRALGPGVALHPQGLGDGGLHGGE